MNFIPKKSFHFPGSQGHEIYEHEKPGLCWQDFFPDPVPENITPLRHLFSPNFGIFKVQGVCPMEKDSATLGLQPKKSVEFLGAEFVGDCKRINRNWPLELYPDMFCARTIANG